jgi:hypothetical protein
MERTLKDVVMELRKSHRLIRELRICFVLEGVGDEVILVEPILPSSPTADTDLLVDLLALRIERIRLPSAAAAIRMFAATIPERSIQSELFTVASQESRKEVDKVFARLRGIFGNSCVQRALLEDEHIPERRYSWEDLDQLPRESEQDIGSPLAAVVSGATGKGCTPGQMRRNGVRQGVRRIFFDPRLPPRRGITRRWDPYPISGRWWCGEKPRKYCFAETKNGEIIWLCLEEPDGQWRQIGVVE